MQYNAIEAIWFSDIRILVAIIEKKLLYLTVDWNLEILLMESAPSFAGFPNLISILLRALVFLGLGLLRILNRNTRGTISFGKGCTVGGFPQKDKHDQWVGFF